MLCSHLFRYINLGYVCGVDEVRSSLLQKAPDLAMCLERLCVDESAWIASRLKGFCFAVTVQWCHDCSNQDQLMFEWKLKVQAAWIGLRPCILWLLMMNQGANMRKIVCLQCLIWSIVLWLLLAVKICRLMNRPICNWNIVMRGMLNCSHRGSIQGHRQTAQTKSNLVYFYARDMLHQVLWLKKLISVRTWLVVKAWTLFAYWPNLILKSGAARLWPPSKDLSILSCWIAFRG